MNKELINLETFRVRLNKQGVDYVCDTTLPDISASISFMGPFSGKTVVWDMTLLVTECGEKPYIEIKQGCDGVFPVKIGLAVPVIDQPVIKKTIIMMRNYKRLALGRIVFGDMHT